jgi:hypothetical protein
MHTLLGDAREPTTSGAVIISTALVRRASA